MATGQLTNSNGQPVEGTVAVMVWPNETFNRTPRVGSAVLAPTVGWAAAGADGSFALRVDSSQIGAHHVGQDGVVNLEAIGWTSTSGNNFSLGGGVQIAPLLGINLSVNTGYSASDNLHYRLKADGTVCGDNAVPTLASNMNSAR